MIAGLRIGEVNRKDIIPEKGAPLLIRPTRIGTVEQEQKYSRMSTFYNKDTIIVTKTTELAISQCCTDGKLSHKIEFLSGMPVIMSDA